MTINYSLVGDDSVVSQLNPLLQSIADRLSQLEGWKGKPRLQHYAQDEGAADRYIINPDPPWQSDQIIEGVQFRFVAAYTNTGASTLTVNGNEYSIYKDVDSELAAGDIVADQVVEVFFDGVNFQYDPPTTASGSDTFAIIQVDGVAVSTNAPTLDFDGTDFTLTESPTDDFDITIKAERIQDLVGAMVSGNTETGITVTYQDSDGTIDFAVATPTAITVANEATDTTCFPTFFTAATGDLDPKTNASFTLNSNTAQLGIATINLTGGQIVFPASQSASANANTLDDYEEGTWTPTIQDTTNSDAESQAYSVQSGRYVKIGLVVFFWGIVTTSSIGTLTGADNVRIAGLPFTSESGANLFGGVKVMTGTGLAITAGNAVSGVILNNTSHFVLRVWDAATGTSNMTVTQWSADGNATFFGCYRATA